MRLLLVLFLFISSAGFATEDAGRSDFKRSLKLYNQKKFKQSRVLQMKLVDKYPDNALYWFNLGTSSYMSKEYGEALTAFGQVESLHSPLAPAAQLYRAKTQVALRDTGSAIVLLQNLLAEDRLPPALRAQAEDELLQLVPPLAKQNEKILELYHAHRYQDALDLIDKTARPDADLKMLKGLILVRLNRPDEAHQVLETVPESNSADPDRISLLQYLIDQTKRDEHSRKPYWGYVDVSAGYDTNVYYDSTDTRSLATALMKNQWGGGARLYNQSYSAIVAGYSGFWEEVDNAGNLKVVSHQFQVDFNRDTPIEFFQVGPFFQYDEWAAVPAQKRTGLRIKYRKLWSTSSAGGELNFTSIKGAPGPYSYLSGGDTYAHLFWAVDSKKFYGEIYFDYEKANTGDYVYSDHSVLPTAFESSTPGFRMMWKQSDNWILSLQTYFKRRSYPTLSQPEGRARNDIEKALSLRATRLWKPELSTYGTISYLQNDSTLAGGDVRDENYSGAALMAGVLWDFL